MSEDHDTEAKLLNAFYHKGIIDGKELIVRKEYCQDFLQESKICGFAVIGIEGFFLLEDGSVTPNLNEIADFSDIKDDNFDKYVLRCFEAAAKFIDLTGQDSESDGFCFTLICPNN